MRSMIAQTCGNCQSTYEVAISEMKRGNGKYCSRKCSGEANSGQRVFHEPNTSCGWCGIDFYRKPSAPNSKSGLYFCSKQHQDEASRNLMYRTGPISEPRPHRFCMHCNEPLSRRTENKQSLHMACRKPYQINIWLEGDNSITLNRSKTTGLPTDTKEFVKEYLVELRGDKCEICGWNEKAPDGRSIIQMDHINGSCFDNRLENLQLLCPNHHAMTPTYGSLNKGSGRAHRRKVT